MSGSHHPQVALTSPHWYRIRSLAPAWNPDCRISRRRSRNGVTMVLGLEDNGARFSLNASAWAVIGRCDGTTDLDTIWAAIADTDADNLPPQADIIALITQLVGAGILICGDWPDLRQGLAQDSQGQRRERAQRLNPMAPRLALGSPTRLLERLQGLGSRLFSRGGGALLVLLCLTATGIAIEHAGELGSHAGTVFGDWRQWWLPLLCYPPVKALHELAHGLAIQRFGGRVNEAGIGLLLGMPAPYVDASGAEDFPRPGERALVSAAGILAELGIAASALIVWSLTAPGMLRDVCLTLAAIGGISTLLFNGNPLVRLDGYFVLTDLLRLPRLAEESRTLWQARWRRWLLGLRVGQDPQSAFERAMNNLYAPAAWSYRAVLLVWVAGWVGSVSRVAGLAILSAAAIWLVLAPLTRLLNAPHKEGVALRRRVGAWQRAALVGAATLLLAFVPLPDRVWLDGIVWPADDSRVRNLDAGVVSAVLVDDGALVDAGQIVLELHDPDLDARIDQLRTQLAGRRDEFMASLQTRSARAPTAREQMNQAKSQLAALLERREQLHVRAPLGGRLYYIGAPADLLGRHVAAGSDLAAIETGSANRVRALADQFTMARLVDSANAARVAVADPVSSRLLPATWVADAPRAVERLPHPGLARALGGSVDASIAAAGDWEPVRPHYPVSVELATTGSMPAETRARILVSFGLRPLAMQLTEQLYRTIAPRLAPDWS